MVEKKENKEEVDEKISVKKGKEGSIHYTLYISINYKLHVSLHYTLYILINYTFNITEIDVLTVERYSQEGGKGYEGKVEKHKE